MCFFFVYAFFEYDASDLGDCCQRELIRVRQIYIPEFIIQPSSSHLNNGYLSMYNLRSLQLRPPP
jgi:hypothetical protein